MAIKRIHSIVKWAIPANKPSSLALVGIVEGRADAGLRQVCTQLLDVLLGEFIAVVRMVQDKFNPIEHHPEPSAMGGFYGSPQVVE